MFIKKHLALGLILPFLSVFVCTHKPLSEDQHAFIANEMRTFLKIEDLTFPICLKKKQFEGYDVV